MGYVRLLDLKIVPCLMYKNQSVHIGRTCFISRYNHWHYRIGTSHFIVMTFAKHALEVLSK